MHRRELGSPRPQSRVNLVNAERRICPHVEDPVCEDARSVRGGHEHVHTGANLAPTDRDTTDLLNVRAAGGHLLPEFFPNPAPEYCQVDGDGPWRWKMQPSLKRCRRRKDDLDLRVALVVAAARSAARA